MPVLRRFPVSDEFNSYRKTLDSVCDRMNFLDFWGFSGKIFGFFEIVFDFDFFRKSKNNNFF